MSDAPLAVTPGEPAGVGVDLALGLWAVRTAETPAFFLIDDPERVAARARLLGIAAALTPIDDPREAVTAFPNALPVLRHAFPAQSVPGRPDPANGPATVDAITRAVALVRAGDAAAVVTNPIQKETLYQAGFAHPGHTEYLAALSGPNVVPVMLLASPELKVVPVTIHIPLAEVPRQLTTGKIVTTARITAVALQRDFGIAQPRLALAGLNPHAGEGGALGREDGDIIAPAVAALRAEGIDARGPLPADTLFHEEARATYDVVLGMYHDQVLVPIKTLDFWGGVNVTLGLPFVRTSPDHGTALTLAGTGKARIDSLRAAVELARAMSRRRATAQ
ncbi:4-hydroxythreonine-4-phosphate dehydrogenase PdxA [Thalassobaculum litoreum]|uniref:4-hydroxythreonine-4-phosphate dehydrogenase n=1 Tax=Thalassobaculum litoreum DSM 18839 TaxID=1123362 RepID=A0A8G2BFC3_9PROT|nr:4-hydroxythreonine-4-phosphate dehydrogenase PdxA [Thalassobaculum litoreum]SDF05888.1 4-hydroxythreonine-4-phosphate dehydrogenase [Thalassobaculum litoreum DSM 18839]